MENNDDYGNASASSTTPRNTAFRFNGLQVKFFKAKEPTTVDLDIIQRPDNTIGFKYKVHQGIGPNKMHDVVCPKQWGGRCPICDLQEQLHEEAKQKFISAGMDEDKAWREAWKDKGVKSLFPKERIVYNVLDAKKRDEILLLDVSAIPNNRKEGALKKTVEDKIQSAASAYKTRHTMPIFKYGHPVEGATMVVTFQEGTFPGSNGKEVRFMDWGNVYFEKRSQPYDMSVLDKVIMVEKYLNRQTFEQIEELLYGAPDAVQDDDGGHEYVDYQEPVETAKPEPVEPPKQTIGVPPPAGVVPEVKVDSRCPHGLRFGVDNDTKEVCEDCDLFTSCRKEKKRLSQVEPNF